MRVVGDSGVVMDLADSVATGLLSSGVVTRVSDEALAVHSLMAPPPAVVPADETAGGLETPSDGGGGTDPVGDDAETGEGGLKLPPGNGAREVWVEFALANGKTEDDLLGQTQTQIREMFKPAAE